MNTVGSIMCRKKPVVIEARQLTSQNIYEVHEWVHGPVNIPHLLAQDRWDDYCKLVEAKGMNIPTLEDGVDGRAKHVASIGDYIIKGVKGEFYPCKPDIFEMTYESAALQEFAAEKAGEPVAYIAWKDGKPCYEGDDAICEDAVWPVDSDDDRTSMPVFAAPQPAQPEFMSEVAYEHVFKDGTKILSYALSSAGFPPRTDADHVNLLYTGAQPVAQPDHSNPFAVTGISATHRELIAELRKPMHYLSMTKRNRSADALEGKDV